MTENGSGGGTWQTGDGRRTSLERQSGVAEPNVFSSIWNHRVLVLAFIGVFAVLGVLVTLLRAPAYAAEAGLVLRNPQSTALSDGPVGDELRYVADQVSILKSVAVAKRASAVIATADKKPPIDPREIGRASCRERCRL